MSARTELEIRDTCTRMAVELSNMRHALHEAGLHITGHKVHEAIQELGWETARAIAQTHGDNPEEPGS